MHMKWLEPEPVMPSIEIREAFHKSLLIAEQLSKKGITTVEQSRRFLDPMKSDQTSPFNFPEIEKAAERVMAAIKLKECIGVWGDFDVDGQTSTAILVDGLRNLGAEVAFHIPIRADESHGIQLKSLKLFLNQEKPNLIITCDTGISESESLDYLTSAGIDVIITDHHSLPDIMPSVFATINPRLLSDNHPFASLAGVGTAFQLIRALFTMLKMESDADSYFDLVALGTIADLADLTDENRFYAKSGLKMLSINPREAFKSIARMADLRSQTINESHIGFLFAPRLNALGRLGDANPAVNFLLSKNEKEVDQFARELEQLNTSRKIVSEMVFKSAIELLEKNKGLLQYPVLVLERENWEKGVVGIAASRLAEKYNKPAILLDRRENIAAGSARSVEGINIIKAIKENSRLLIRYGGHPMAAGLSIAVENISEFRENLSRSVNRMSSGLRTEKNLEVDAYLPFNSINESLLLETELLAPFGPGNPPVVLVSRNLEIEKASFIGKSKEHRKLVIKDQEGNTKNAIWWGSVGFDLPESLFDLAFYLRRDDSSSDSVVSLEWLDFREAANQPIEIQREINKFQTHDYRAMSNQLEILEGLASEPEILFWAEGVKIDKFATVNRLQVKKAKSLALLTAPPNREILRDLIEKAEPSNIFLFNLFPVDDTFDPFIKNLVGMLNYSLSHNGGRTNIRNLEAALGKTRKIVVKGQEFLREKGNIEFSLSGDEVEILRVEKPGSLIVLELKNSLEGLLNEVSAFRSYYQRADPIFLLSNIKK